MTWLFILLFATSVILVNAVPSRTSLAAKIHPSCFPTRPYCIRPQLAECRDAILLMGAADPGYPVILGRADIVGGLPHSYSVPQIWNSVPKNCVLKIDVTDPRDTEVVALKSLILPAEILVEECIIRGTGCGGSILAGKKRVLKLTLAYYTALHFSSGFLEAYSNDTFHTTPAAEV